MLDNTIPVSIALDSWQKRKGVRHTLLDPGPNPGHPLFNDDILCAVNKLFQNCNDEHVSNFLEINSRLPQEFPHMSVLHNLIYPLYATLIPMHGMSVATSDDACKIWCRLAQTFSGEHPDIQHRFVTLVNERFQ